MVKKRPVEILRSALCHVARGASLCALELSPGMDLPQTHPGKSPRDFGSKGLSESSSCPCLACRTQDLAMMAARDEGSRRVRGEVFGSWCGRDVMGAHRDNEHNS